VNNKVSDIHIEPFPGKEDVQVRMRIDGAVRSTRKFLQIQICHSIAHQDHVQPGYPSGANAGRKIDFKKFGPLNVELRVATVPTAGQLEDVVMRVLASGEPIPYDKLGLTERNSRVLDACVKQPYGLVLVVGPTGSGKTTTLHSAISVINTIDTKIWTAEDPVEITQRGLRQVQVHPRLVSPLLRLFVRFYAPT